MYPKLSEDKYKQTIYRLESYLEMNPESANKPAIKLAEAIFQDSKKKGYYFPSVSNSRLIISKYRKKRLDLDVSISTETTTETNQYSSNSSSPKKLTAWCDDLGRNMNIDEYCKKYGLPRNDIRSYKLVSHTGFWYFNIAFHEVKFSLTFDDYEEIADKLIEKHNIRKYKGLSSNKFKDSLFVDRLIYTDVHIGMTTNPNGYSLYGGKWDRDELFDRAEQMVRFVIDNQKSYILYVDDLGDFLDGWNKKTTREGHELPQNMDNEAAFDAGVDFKMFVLDNLIDNYSKIVFRNICEDNHAGSFAYVVNSTFLRLAKAKYGDRVHVVNQRDFIDYYIVGKHAIATTHGKDSKEMKYGFNPKLDPKQIEKIDGYFKNEEVYSKAKYIEFSKGDSHQCLFDLSGSDDFDYFNYPAFSPSSKWVQTNFKRGRSGFVLQHIDTNSRNKEIKPYWFKWKKNKRGKNPS